VSALGAFVKVEVIGAVKHVDAVVDVFARVRMHHIKENGKAHLVGLVDEALELFGSAVAGRTGKKVGDLIAER
jgi:hypothetical protein